MPNLNEHTQKLNYAYHCAQLSYTTQHRTVSIIFPFISVRYMLSPVRLSSVCNARALYSGGSNFRQYFYGIGYLGHPLTCT